MAPRGPYAKTARVQSEIIESAAELFAERGYTGTSMREIAAVAGMTLQGIQHHFPAKERLLEAVLERRAKLTLEQYGGDDLSAPDVLRGLVRDNIRSAGLVQLSNMLSAEAINPDHPAHTWFIRRFTRARKTFEVVIQRGQDEGDFRTDLRARELSVLVVSVFEGMQLQWLLDGSIGMEPVLESLLKLLAKPQDRGKR